MDNNFTHILHHIAKVKFPSTVSKHGVSSIRSAEFFSVTKQTFENWLNGKSFPSKSQKLRIKAFLMKEGLLEEKDQGFSLKEESELYSLRSEEKEFFASQLSRDIQNNEQTLLGKMDKLLSYIDYLESLLEKNKINYKKISR